MDKETPKIFSSEREPRLVTPEESESLIADAKKAMEKHVGVMGGEFNDWWLGKKGVREGAKELAGWVFDKLLMHRELIWNWKNGETSRENVTSVAPDFFETIEPSLRRLVSEVLKYGGQEHLNQYFWDDWAQGEWTNAQRKDAAERVWEIYQKYLNEIGGKV